jgi:hypothetical protein
MFSGVPFGLLSLYENEIRERKPTYVVDYEWVPIRFPARTKVWRPCYVAEEYLGSPRFPCNNIR